MISDAVKARRLARAIASDIKLYNEEKLSRGEDLTAEIEEGRALYCARVDPTLMEPYNQAVLELGLRGAPHSRRQPTPKPRLSANPDPVPPLPHGSAFELRSAADATPSMVPLVAIVVLLLSLLGAAAWWWMHRGG